MKAVIATGGLDMSDPNAFLDCEVSTPQPKQRDILVKIEAVAINPVDIEVFSRLESGAKRILGYDARGIVVETGSEARRFCPGQAVYYSGALTREGSYSEYQLVDERLVGLAPITLSPAEAACLPLASLAAFEGLFDRLCFTPATGANQGESLLVIGGAGGVGSMVIQLASWAGITVAATAGRKESADWCQALGATITIGRDDIQGQLTASRLPEVGAIFCTTHAEEHWATMAKILAPQGSICLIDEPAGPLDITLFRQKSARICWEFMFTRSMFRSQDMTRQGLILKKIAKLVEEGIIKSPLNRTTLGLSAYNVRHTHKLQLTQCLVGKQALVV